MNSYEGPEAAALFKRYLETIEAESDRGAVLVGAALLDDALEKILRKKLVPPLKSEDSLFDGGYSPLRSFAAKIELAFRLGLITRNTKQMLNIVRSLRNLFAHNTENVSLFDDQASDRLKTAYLHMSQIYVAIIGTIREIAAAQQSSLSVDELLESESGRRSIIDIFFASNAMALRRVELEVETIAELKDRPQP